MVVIETPKGSPNKLMFDPRCETFVLNGVLPAGAVFPFDFGFVPSTRADVGDPLDVLVLMDAPVYPGCIVPSRLIGDEGQTFRSETARWQQAGARTRHGRDEAPTIAVWIPPLNVTEFVPLAAEQSRDAFDLRQRRGSRRSSDAAAMASGRPQHRFPDAPRATKSGANQRTTARCAQGHQCGLLLGRARSGLCVSGSRPNPPPVASELSGVVSKGSDDRAHGASDGHQQSELLGAAEEPRTRLFQAVTAVVTRQPVETPMKTIERW